MYDMKIPILHFMEATTKFVALCELVYSVTIMVLWNSTLGEFCLH